MANQRRIKRAVTEKNLDQLSVISPSDIADAEVAWTRDASPAFARLLDAKPDDVPPPPASQ